MKLDNTYEKLRDSLRLEQQNYTVDDLEITQRNCYDRKPGQLDLRTRAGFETTGETPNLHPDLRRNLHRLCPPETVQDFEPLKLIRYQFGWRNRNFSPEVEMNMAQIPWDMGSLQVRIYQCTPNEQCRPCLVFIHGGGFVAGDMETVEEQCKYIAKTSGGIVVSVDYPLAPESQFPAQLEACWQTIVWCYANATTLGIDHKRIGVSGDSAGGNLALACSCRDRDMATGYIAYQALIYPVLSFETICTNPHYYWNNRVYENPENDSLIAQQCHSIGEIMETIATWLIPAGCDRMKPDISPITAPVNGLPATLLLMAEYDFLRCECQAYAIMLKKAGVPLNVIQYGGICHGTFDRLGYAPQVEDMLMEISQLMNDGLVEPD